MKYQRRTITWVEVDCLYPGIGKCWECTSHKRDRKGYPKHLINGINTCMHRTIYENAHGPIPKGMVVRHKCDNTSCINPDHLEIGTSKDNARDRDARGRGKSPLTKEQVMAIKKDSRKQRVIAADYNIAQSSVSNIKTGFRWGWVD